VIVIRHNCYMGSPGRGSTGSPAGQRLIGGRYRLRRRIGSGTMGVVWSGYDEVLHRPVAVKEVRRPPGMPDDEVDALRERTLREARAIASLSHPNVITVYDVVRENGAPFVVMELLSGNSLAELVRSHGRLDVTQVAALADGVAAGLDAAHRRGITHRDVKPGNVLIGADDRIKLGDFGIARNPSDKSMTQSGIVLGSPAYMAPEVAAGRPVTPAADLWSLGATLFCATEGIPPYDADGNALSTLTAVVHGEVPVPKFAGELRPVISALMHKDPAARMDLMGLRRAIYRLLPEPGRLIFPVSDPTTRVTPVEVAPESPEQPAYRAPEALPLATDPGPLPFGDGPVVRTPRPLGTHRQAPEPATMPARKPVPPAVQAPVQTPVRQPGRRSTLISLLVGLLAAVLFVASAGGAFALARTLAGRPLSPRAVELGTVAGGAPAPLRQFVSRQGNATTLSGAQGGNFAVAVPEDWQMFTEQRTSDALPASTVVHYVSPDGSYEITVERIEGFFPDHDLAQYVASVRESSSGAKFESANAAQQLMYRTVESTGATGAPTGAALGRTTYLRTRPAGSDLWVVGATVPTDQEDAGRTELFGKVAASFRPFD
jgi:tRNA A-37 threonylcarbamoyl transferase component Bud32